jgi:CRISPR-associated protein Cas2
MNLFGGLTEGISMLVLVVYDISDDRRRLKLSTFLEGYGRRVQESVFECFIDLNEMKKLYCRIQKKVKPELDNVPMDT